MIHDEEVLNDHFEEEHESHNEASLVYSSEDKLVSLCSLQILVSEDVVGKDVSEDLLVSTVVEVLEFLVDSVLVVVHNTTVVEDVVVQVDMEACLVYSLEDKL